MRQRGQTTTFQTRLEISIVDVVSRLKVESYPGMETTNPSLPDYQLTLRGSTLVGRKEILTGDGQKLNHFITESQPSCHCQVHSFLQ
jgi:hypothetical protein